MIFLVLSQNDLKISGMTYIELTKGIVLENNLNVQKRITEWLGLEKTLRASIFNHEESQL